MLAALACVALIQAPAPAPADLERERALASRVDPARAAERVRALCALGARIGGSESNRRAAELVRALFAEAGLEASIVEDPETWCHEERAWELALVRGAGEAAERVPLASAWPWGFSPAGEGEAPLALEPREGAAWLSKRVRRAPKGTPEVALLLVDGATTSDGRYPVVAELARPGEETRPVFGLSETDGELLRAALADGGAEPRIAWRLDASSFRGAPLTVEARLAPRAELPETAAAGCILLCAHGDSDAGGPGANDNASGVAILLEIAQAWSEAIAAGELAPPSREVRFAVWGREIHSSKAWLARAAGAGALPRLVVNYDQAGFGSGDDRLHVEPDDDPAALAFVERFEALLAAHATDPAQAFAAQLLPARWSTNKGLGGTDAYVFARDEGFAAAGGAAVTLFASAWGRSRDVERTPGRRGESWHESERVLVDHDVHYHSAGDTPENTTDREPWNLAWGARVGWLVLLRWLDADR